MEALVGALFWGKKTDEFVPSALWTLMRSFIFVDFKLADLIILGPVALLTLLRSFYLYGIPILSDLNWRINLFRPFSA